MRRGLNPDCGPTTLTIKVSHGNNQHGVSVPSNSTFGYLKTVIVKKIGLKPGTYKLLFRGKEKEDDEDLQRAGVKDNSKVVLMEDMTCRNGFSQGSEAVAAVREEVDMFSEQVSALQAVVDSGSQISEKHINYLNEMLTRLLLKLDAIEAEGEGKVQRKTEVRRIQSIADAVDVLKSRNSNLSCDGNHDISPTTSRGISSRNVFSQGGEAVAAVREEVDMFSEQVSALQAIVNTGSQISEKHISYLTEMLMEQLLKLDAIEAEGGGRVERKTEVDRIQSIFDALEVLKSRNSNLSCDGNHDISSTTSPMPSGVPADMASSASTSTPYSTTSTAKFVNLRRECLHFSESNIGSANEKFTKYYWERICQKIVETPPDDLSTVKSTIDYLIMQMKKYTRDTKPLEGKLRSFFEGAYRYNKAKLESIQKGTQEVHEKSLFLAQQDLLKVEALESEQVNMANGLKAELLLNTCQQKELRARLAELINEEKLIYSSLYKAEENLSNIQQSAATQREHVSKLLKSPYMSKQEVDDLKKMEVGLEESRRDLAAFDLFA